MTLQTSANPRPDAATGTAIRDALAAARAGRLQEACALAERGLAAGADPVPIAALLGMLRLDLGDHGRAVEHLEFAHDRQPNDIRITTNLLSALVALERFDRALQVATRDVAFSDASLQLARIRGFVADQAGDPAAAAEALEHVVKVAPSDWESWNNLGNVRRSLEDWEGSLEAHRRAVEINPSSAPARLNYAAALAELGRLDEAEAEYRQMTQDFPDDPKPYRELHVIYKDQNRDEEALDAITRAVERDPDNIEYLLGRASHFSTMVRMDEAEQGYRRVLALDPVQPNAYLGIALAYELMNNGDALAALVKEAEEVGLAEEPLRFVRAYHHRRAKEYEAGLAALEGVGPELETTRRLHLLAQLLEGAGRYDEAFEAYSRMNDLFRDDGSQPEERAERYRTMIRRAREAVNEDWLSRWRPDGNSDPRPAPVFLVGFPRSGTTLLDTILMSHPNIEVLEEEPPLRRAHEKLADLESWPAATDEQIQAGRDAYFECAQALTPLKPGNLLVDKNPLTMNLLPLVRRLFPEAKVILALRHPCDVILSCYFANFRLNDGMANFIRLDTAADLYDASFSYYEHVQKLMPFATHVSVYEKLVADRESELRGLFDFLGLDWHDAVLDHQTTALKRGRIKTASYAQVVEPIYSRSAGRWQKYRKHLDPVLPVLEPWVRKFGYEM